MAAASAVESAAGRTGPGWIGSPGWDLFWMFSALWGGALLLTGGAFVDILVFAGAVLVAQRFVSICHSWSTTYMVLLSPLLASERSRKPRKYLYTPIAIVALSFALGIGVAAWQRFPADGHFGARLWIFALYIALFWVGHFWHFGNQDFGVLTLYRLKAGQRGAFERKVDKAYTVAMMFVIQPIVYLSIVRTTAFAEMAYTWLPVDVAILTRAADVCIGAAALLTLGVVAYELRKPNRSLPKLLYYGVIFLHPTLLWGSLHLDPTFAPLYFVAYLWSHWFIAIGLVSRINAHYYRTRGDSEGRSLLRHALVIGGIAAFVWLLTYGYSHYGLFNTPNFGYKKLLAAITPGQQLVIGLFLGFFLAEQLLHYYCDRCLFRFRDAGVRRKVAPLLLESS